MIHLRIALLIIAAASCSAADAPAPSGPAGAGPVRMGMNVFDTGYADTAPRFANILLHFTGFDRGPYTADAVSMVNGSNCFFECQPGIWPTSGDERETQYQLTYHCDDPDRDSWRHGREKLVFTGFTVAVDPTGDEHGDYTGWLRFDGPPKGGRINVQTAYAAAACDAKTGVAQYPLTLLKIRHPGCSDQDFITPTYRQRMGGFTRLRFCDAGGMNGRSYSKGLTVPGTQPSKGIGALAACNSPANVQTQTNGDAGLSWGGGPGKGRPFTFWNGKDWTTFPWGLGCKAPCTMVFPLNREYALLLGSPAVDHEVDEGKPGPHGDVTLKISLATVDKPADADWKVAARFEHLSTAKGQVGLGVDLTGATFMKIEVDGNGDDEHAHLDLINAHLWQITKWRHRMTPTSCCCSYYFWWMGNHGDQDGPVLEYLLREANELGSDPMFNVPIMADDEYLRNFAKLLVYGTDASGKPYDSAQAHPVNPPLDIAHGRTVYLEEDNEVWNWGYNCWLCADDFARFHGITCYREFARRAAHMSEIIKGEFAAAGHPESVKVIFSNNVMGEGTSQDAFDWLSKENGGKPMTTWFDRYAFAPYFGPDNAKYPRKATLDDVYRLADEGLDTSIGWMKDNAAFARKHHLELTTYEGGIEMTVTGDGHHDGLYRQAMAGRRAGRILDRYHAAWRRIAGADAIINYYSGIDAARFNGGGQWAVLPRLSADVPGSVRYDAVLRASHPAGDCDNDQKVTLADFRILAQNFGKGQWWSQGDFDNDGDVGLDDYWLLYANLSKEDQQRPEVADFPKQHPGPWVLGSPDDPQGGYALATWKNADPREVEIAAHELGAESSWKTPFSYVQVTAPRHGTLDLSGYPRVRYAPAKNYVGIDDCVIAVKDADGAKSNPVWLWIDVRPDRLNGSFERCIPKPYPGQLSWDAEVAQWRLGRGAGICASKGPVLGGREAPDGEVVAFLQNEGAAITQEVELAAGSYTVSFKGLNRDTCEHAKVAIAIDGTAGEPFDLHGKAWTPCGTPPLQLAAGKHTLALTLVGGDGKKPGDTCAAIDQVELAPYRPLSSVTAWTVLASPQPARTPIVIEAEPTGGVSPLYQFLVDGAVAQDYSANARCVWTPAKPGAVAITVKAKDRTGASADAAPIAFTVTAAAPVIQNGCFQICVPHAPKAGEFAYVPNVSAPGWTLSKGAGICGNKGPFLNGVLDGANADDAAFMQGLGTQISQEVEFPAAGSFTLSFSAACRNTSASVGVSVLLDGQPVGPKPFSITAPTAWTKCETPAFAVTPGPHTLAIKVVEGVGDITADITAVALNAR